MVIVTLTGPGSYEGYGVKVNRDNPTIVVEDEIASKLINTGYFILIGAAEQEPPAGEEPPADEVPGESPPVNAAGVEPPTDEKAESIPADGAGQKIVKGGKK